MEKLESAKKPRKSRSSSQAGSAGVSPDSAEQPKKNFLVVGIGASAGGVTALEKFFGGLPASKTKLNMAFVVVTHLSPEHESNLAAIIQNYTSLPVIQVNEEMPLKPNTVYVIPPGKQLLMNDINLSVTELEKNRNDRAPIDLFFRSLAETYTDWSAAVVLSGSGSDGSIGLPRVKEMGGLALVQEPEEAQYSQMPKSGISTGFADRILPVGQMGQWLLSYSENKHNINLQLPGLPASEPEAEGHDEDKVEHEGDTLLEILALLRVRTGHNFALYKRSTLKRRIERRMQVNHQSNLAGYLAYLVMDPGELQALLRDLLISVTNFFRDREVWESLATNVIPTLFVGKDTADSVVRVWIAGCATGEEAYSMAILLHEYASRLTFIPKLQIFASDLDDRAIAIAREGSYPETISLDVSPERLHNYFTHSGRRYRVRKELREIILFAGHDLLKDPPFSRLDLVSCRNLLIYLNRDAQDQLLALFHFALRPEGFLLLGTSETADGSSLLFSNYDKKQHIYTRRAVPRFYQPLTVVPPPPPLARRDKRPDSQMLPGSHLPDRLTEKNVLPSELHQSILEMYAPPSVVIDENFDIVHLSNEAGRYLQFRGGEPTMNLLRLVSPELRLDMRSGLYNATQYGKTTETRRMSYKRDGIGRLLRLIIRPIKEPTSLQGYILVIFDEIDESAEKENLQLFNGSSEDNLNRGEANSKEEALVQQLEEENEVIKGQLRTTIEQYETSVEELKASNEELHAINEELRSATEELETSREELQAVNEELLTVNQELKIKVEEVSHVNSDLQNLMVSTDIATIFLNRNLQIKRYTPKVEQLFNIIPTDLDRPLIHLTHRLQYKDLPRDVEKVMRELVPVIREVKSLDDQWYMVRVLPYRTLEDRINGIVLTFLDITARKHSEQALLESEERFRTIVNQATAGVCRVDLDGKLTLVNHKMGEILGYSEAEITGKSIFEYINPTDASEYRRLFNRMVSEDQAFQVENRLTHKDSSVIWVNFSVSPLRDTNGEVYSAVMVIIDISESKKLEITLRESEERLRRALEIETVGVIFFRTDGSILSANGAFLKMSGYSQEDAAQGLVRWDTMTPPEWMPQSLHAIEEFQTRGETTPYEKEYIRKDGSRWWGLFAATRINGEEGVEYIIDITERKQAEEALRESEARFRVVVNVVPDLMWSNDQQGIMLWYNQRWLEYTGQTLEEAVKASGLEFVHPDDREQARLNFLGALDQGQPLNQEYRLRGIDGQYRWFLVRAQPLIDETGKVQSWFGAATDIHEQRLAQDELEGRIRQRTAELEDANHSLQLERKRLAELSTRLIQVQETERRFLARELHDEVGQYLTGIKFMLESIKSQPLEVRDNLLLNALGVVDELTTRVQELSLNLRPSVLDEMGLVPALTLHIQRFTKQTGMKIDFRQRGMETRLPSEIEITIFRLVQEALTNVVRHSGVTKALVQIMTDGSSITVVVQDQGKGFVVQDKLADFTSVGLASMRERVDLVGGTLTVESSPGNGTTLMAEISLDKSPEKPPEED